MFGMASLIKQITVIADQVTLIREILQPRLSASLKFSQGENMPATVLVGQTATSTWTEWSGPNGTGQQLPPAGPVTYTSSNTAVATVDPNTGIATGVAVGTSTISGTDSTNTLTASDTLTVTETAQSATLVLSANAPTPSAKKPA